MNRRFAVALMVAVGAFLLVAPQALAAQVTKTLNFPLNGNSTTNLFSQSFACCEVSFSVDPFGSFDGNISGGMSLDMATTLSAPTHNDLSYTDTNLRQGKHLDLTNTFTADPGTFNVNYTLGGSLDVYGIHFDYSKSAGDTLSCQLPLLTDTCSHTTNVTLFSFTVLDVGVAYFNINILAPITTTANITGDGMTSHRTMTDSGIDVSAPTDLNFTQSPGAADEGVDLSCSLPANQPVNYAMGDASGNVGGNVAEGIGIGVSGTVYLRALVTDVDILDVGPFDFPLFTLPAVAFNSIALTAPGQNVDLGNLQPNIIPPTVAMDTIPTTGTEGAPIQLKLKGNGPGGSMSPCGDNSLSIHWSFDDGGSAFGKTINHAWADNFLGTSPPHSGTVTIKDPTGLSTTIDFSVPVANTPPTVAGGPDKTTYWGIPVSFHGNGSDAGPADNLSLLYAWEFGDPVSPIGASGQDASHVYSVPTAAGTPDVAKVTVTDNDGSTGNATVNVTVLKRGSTLGYIGDTAFRVTDSGMLRASLGDGLTSKPVPGRSVAFYVDGNPAGSAVTDNSGNAALSYTPPLGATGAHCVVATFAGDGYYTQSSSNDTCSPAGTSFAVAKNAAALSYTGLLSASPSKSVTLTAKLVDDLGRALTGKVVNFTLGSQTCNGQATASTGIVSCTIPKLTQNPGKYSFTASFAGDANYLASSVNAVYTVGR